jgi:hypothetical protein
MQRGSDASAGNHRVRAPNSKRKVIRGSIRQHATYHTIGYRKSCIYRGQLDRQGGTRCPRAGRLPKTAVPADFPSEARPEQRPETQMPIVVLQHL